MVGGFDPGVINYNTTLRLDMSTGTWDTGPTFTPQLGDFGLAYDPGTNKLYSLGGDLPNDGNFFNSTNQVNELDVSAWPGGTWNPSPPDLPLPNRQANQAGFFGNGDIWSVGGLDGATFIFNEVWHRNKRRRLRQPNTDSNSYGDTKLQLRQHRQLRQQLQQQQRQQLQPGRLQQLHATATATPTAPPRSSPTPRPRPHRHRM